MFIKNATTPNKFKINLKNALISHAFYSINEFFTYNWQTDLRVGVDPQYSSEREWMDVKSCMFEMCGVCKQSFSVSASFT